MAESEDEGSKTEQPSERKLRKAREKGNVPVSKEAGHLMGYAALLATVAWVLPGQGTGVAQGLGSLFTLASQADLGSGEEALGDLGALLWDPLKVAGLATFGALGLFLLGGILAGFLQGPFVVSAERIMPKGNKISPMRGLRRIASADNLVEFAKSLAKLLLIGANGMAVAWGLLGDLLPGTIAAPEGQPGMLSSGATTMLTWVCALMLPVVLADMLWKRFSFLRKQRMSQKELRDEHKDTEGDPFTKSKQAQIRRQRARHRITTAVPKATLVVTNPTHYAVALRYERGVDSAPVCVAKGVDLLAAQIRRIAHEHEVPVIESRELARALYASAEIDKAIPEAHWQAVARLVNFVFDLRRRIRRKPPEGAVLRRPGDEERDEPARPRSL